MSAATLNSDPITSAVQGVGSLSRLKAETEWLRSGIVHGRPSRVDKVNKIIYGRVLAEKGEFKSEGRGEFDDKSLDLIVELAKAHPNGLKSRWTHPSLSADGLGKFLGRDQNIRRDGDKVRGDFHISATALKPPPGGNGTPLGEYVIDLADEDPAAFGSSLVLKSGKEYRLNPDGIRIKGTDGNDLPPLWRPEELHAIDVVDEGDAVHSGFLGTNLPDSIVREVSAALDKQFDGCDRATVLARGQAFLDRYLDNRFEDDMSAEPETGGGQKPAPQPPQPRPQANPPQPTPAPTPQPNPPTGELSAEIARLREEALAELRAERQAIAARRQAEDATACLAQAEAMRGKGEVTSAATTETAGFLSLGEFLHRLDNTEQLATETLGGKESPVTLRRAFLKLLPTLRPAASDRERVPQGGDRDLPLSTERRNELLSATPVGRAILREQAIARG